MFISEYLGTNLWLKNIELITRDDGQHFIEVEDYSWETDQIGFYHIEVPNDPVEANKFWFDFNDQNFNKNCCCTNNPCLHS